MHLLHKNMAHDAMKHLSNCSFKWDANKSMLVVTENCFTIF